MTNAMIQVIKFYAEMANVTPEEVLNEIQSGNEEVRKTVQVLLFQLA